MKSPQIKTSLPGPQAHELIKHDKLYVVPRYTRAYPMVVEKTEDLWVQDVDGKVFPDFTAGIAVCSTSHCHPKVLRAIKHQVDCLLHMSGSDFYYLSMIALAEKLVSIAPGRVGKKSALWQFWSSTYSLSKLLPLSLGWMCTRVRVVLRPLY